MHKSYLLVLFMISPLFLGGAFGHQSDSVGDYRIEIDWKNKPIVTGESNAIIVYVSEMDKSKEAADQPLLMNYPKLHLVHLLDFQQLMYVLHYRC